MMCDTSLAVAMNQANMCWCLRGIIVIIADCWYPAFRNHTLMAQIEIW